MIKSKTLKIKAFAVLTGLLSALFCGLAQTEELEVRVSKENAVLRTVSGDVLCPKNSIFRAVKKDDANFEARGELFGFPVRGLISSTEVEIVSSGSLEKATVSGSLAPSSVAPEAPRQQKEKDRVAVPPAAAPSSPVSYFGKTLTPEFAQFFYERIREENCLKNINSKEIIPRDKVPVVNSADDCNGLINGDIVILDGSVAYASDDSYTIKIFNELYTLQDCPVKLVKIADEKESSPKTGRNYKGYAVFGDYDADAPSFDEKARFTFKEAAKSEMFISFGSFLDSLASGATYQIKCPKCDGKGQKKDLKGKMQRCTNCKGTGLLSNENTIINIELDFKKRSGK